MPTTRAQRRRRYVLWTVLLVVVLLGSLFVRDVSRSAHGTVTTRRSENRSFAALVKVLVTEENQFDGHLKYLLSDGQTLTRANFEARLEQLDQQLPSWAVQASFLASPALAHHVNTALAALTVTRANDYQDILANVAASLQLPWSATGTVDVAQSAQSTQTSLVSTNAAWSEDRWALVREPGHVTLPPTSDLVGTLDLSGALANLAASPLLQITRGVGIAAVLVNPAPLPAPAGEILLPPTSSIRLGITVSNASYVLQNVALTLDLRPDQWRTYAASAKPCPRPSARSGPLPSCLNCWPLGGTGAAQHQREWCSGRYQRCQPHVTIWSSCHHRGTACHR